MTRTAHIGLTEIDGCGDDADLRPRHGLTKWSWSGDLRAVNGRARPESSRRRSRRWLLVVTRFDATGTQAANSSHTDCRSDQATVVTP